MINSTEDVSLYIIMNSEGKFYRRKGYSGSGKTWVEGIDTARIYVKLGPARSQVTYFANLYPALPAPQIVRLHVTSSEILDETERVSKAKDRKQKRQEQNNLRQKKWRLKQAQEDLADAQKRLNNFKE